MTKILAVLFNLWPRSWQFSLIFDQDPGSLFNLWPIKRIEKQKVLTEKDRKNIKCSNKKDRKSIKCRNEKDSKNKKCINEKDRKKHKA